MLTCRSLFGRQLLPLNPIVVAEHCARHVNDLLRMAPKMRNAVEDRRKSRHVKALNTADLH